MYIDPMFSDEPESNPKTAEIWRQVSFCLMYLKKHQPLLALGHAMSAKPLAEEAADPYYLSLVYQYLYLCNQLQGDLSTAKAWVEEGLERCRNLGYKRGVMLHLVDLGRVHLEMKNADLALPPLEEALALALAEDHKGIAALCNIVLGLAYKEVGQLVDAIQALGKANEDRIKDRDWHGAATAQVYLANQVRLLGERRFTKTLLDWAIPVLQQWEDYEMALYGLREREALLEEYHDEEGGRYDELMACYDEQLTIAKLLGPSEVAQVYINKGMTLIGADEQPQAAYCFAEALSLAKTEGNRRLEAVALYGIGIAANTKVVTKKALLEALPLLREAGEHYKVICSLTELSELALKEDPQKALKYGEEAVALCREHECKRLLRSALMALGSANLHLGNGAVATEQLLESYEMAPSKKPSLFRPEMVSIDAFPELEPLLRNPSSKRN